MRQRVAILVLLLAAATAAFSPGAAAAASVDGINLHWTSTGSGPRTLVLVHGWTCDDTSWSAQVPALSKKYRVITIDLPGHGKSGMPKGGAFTMDLFARAVEAVRVEAKADRLVILLTDGDETCGGDPAAAIEKLVKAGVRVNIVGFAIDDAKLAATLRHWSDVAGGMYFEAQDARGLDAAMTEATKAGFTILSAQNQVVAEGTVGGEPVSVMPGSYTVKLSGKTGRSQPITVKPKETTAVQL